MSEIRYGENKDLEWLIQKDGAVSEEWIKRCIGLNEYIVAVDNGNLVGFLRFSMFWGKIPYMDMIKISEELQRKGIGTELYQYWENEMIKGGAKVLMTSSTSHEAEPQNWHMINGFKKAGEISFGKSIDDQETFMIKELS